jgi:hypothetical protein
MDVLSLYQQALDYTAEGMQKYGYVTRSDLTCREVRDATVTRRNYFPDRSYVGSVYDGKSELIRATLRFNQGDIFPVDTVRLDDLSALSAQPSAHPVAIYGGILFPILGHFFFESVARLWPLLWCGCGAIRRLPVYYHPWPGLEISALMANPLYRRTFRVFGLEPSDIHVIEHPQRFDTLVVPDSASTYHVDLNSRMMSVFDEVANGILERAPGTTHQSRSAGRRVYLSRSRWTENRRIVNEEAIDGLMANRGLEIIHTETLAPIALMSLLKNADLVVAADGSHAHLAAFCRNGIRSVMLDTRPVPTQFAIAALRAFSAVHIPLFQSELYRFEQGITDMATLGQLVDQALA